MGMYTELILGASLKKDTPDSVINTLKYMAGEIDEEPEGFPFKDQSARFTSLLNHGSYYFAVNNPVVKIWQDEISRNWRISSRSNIKNYDDEIETFLAWLKPYIEAGSGSKDMYAVVIFETQDIPAIYYLER
jgi:hypothetical protein